MEFNSIWFISTDLDRFLCGVDLLSWRSSIESYWFQIILMSADWFQFHFTDFSSFELILIDFKSFWLILIDSDRFYWISIQFDRFQLISIDFNTVYRLQLTIFYFDGFQFNSIGFLHNSQSILMDFKSISWISVDFNRCWLILVPFCSFQFIWIDFHWFEISLVFL